MDRIREALALIAAGKLDEATRLLEAILADADLSAELSAVVTATLTRLKEAKPADAGHTLAAAVPATQARESVPVALGAPTHEGRLWDVTLIKAGLSKNGHLYPADLLQSSLHMFEGLRCYDSHLSDADMAANPVRKVGDLLGWFDNARWNEAAQSVQATFHVVSQWLRDLLVNLHKESRQDLVGFSIDSFVRTQPRIVEGQVARAVTELVKLNSVDLVTEPAAGGSLDRLVASAAPAAAAPPSDLVLRFYRMELRQALDNSELPQPAREHLYRQLSDTVQPMERATAAIADHRKLLADLSPGAKVTAAGIIRDVHPVMETSDFARDLEALCGWADPGYKPRLRRLSDWYIAMTGDSAFAGVVAPHRVTEANVTTATMANVCMNVLNKRLLAEWAPMERWWEPIVAMFDEPLFQTVSVLKTYGFAALATVGEGDPYVEQTWDDTRETAAFLKKGNYVGVTLEAIMADNVAAIRRIPAALARTWYYTISDAVSNVFTAAAGVGPNMADGTAVFAAGAARANLTTAALAFSSFDAAQISMMSKLEPGSSRKLAVPGKFLLVPVNLRTSAYVLRNSINRPGIADNDVNPWYQQFEVIVVPPWTDANDWALVADPARLPCISLHFLNGNRLPELFTADNPLAGSMFTNDELRIKVRGIFATAVGDFRGLHKANVV